VVGDVDLATRHQLGLSALAPHGKGSGTLGNQKLGGGWFAAKMGAEIGQHVAEAPRLSTAAVDALVEKQTVAVRDARTSLRLWAVYGRGFSGQVFQLQKRRYVARVLP
jgi:hypothetical protein